MLRSHCGTCEVFVDGALAPWQRILEGVEEIPEDPGKDGVVVHSHQKGHDHRSNTCKQQQQQTTKNTVGQHCSFICVWEISVLCLDKEEICLGDFGDFCSVLTKRFVWEIWELSVLCLDKDF